MYQGEFVIFYFCKVRLRWYYSVLNTEEKKSSKNLAWFYQCIDYLPYLLINNIIFRNDTGNPNDHDISQKVRFILIL